MTRNIICDLNLNRNEIKNALAEKLSTAPQDPSEGQVYYDTTLKKIGYYDGNEWIYGSEGSNSLKQVSDLTDYVPEDNEIIQYVGESNGLFINRHIYQYKTPVTVPQGSKAFVLKHSYPNYPKGVYIEDMNSSTESKTFIIYKVHYSTVFYRKVHNLSANLYGSDKLHIFLLYDSTKFNDKSSFFEWLPSGSLCFDHLGNLYKVKTSTVDNNTVSVTVNLVMLNHDFLITNPDTKLDCKFSEYITGDVVFSESLDDVTPEFFDYTYNHKFKNQSGDEFTIRSNRSDITMVDAVWWATYEDSDEYEHFTGFGSCPNNNAIKSLEGDGVNKEAYDTSWKPIVYYSTYSNITIGGWKDVDENHDGININRHDATIYDTINNFDRNAITFTNLKKGLGISSISKTSDNITLISSSTLINGETTLTNGDLTIGTQNKGIVFANGSRLSGGTVSLTQSEYDALSDSEKNNGTTYLIKESTIPDLIDQLPVATTSSNGLMSAEDKTFFNNKGHVHISYYSGSFYIDIWKSGNMILVRGNQDTTKQIRIKNVQTKYEGLLPLVEFYSSYDKPISYSNNTNNGDIIYYSTKNWSTIVLIAANFAPLPDEIASSDIVISDIS